MIRNHLVHWQTCYNIFEFIFDFSEIFKCSEFLGVNDTTESENAVCRAVKKTTFLKKLRDY